MLSPEAKSATRGRAHHHREPHLSPRQVAHLRGFGNDLVERDAEELDEHDLDDRAQAARGGPDRGAQDRRLRDRRVAHTIRTELSEETGGHLEDAAGLGHVLAEHDDGRIAGHFVADRQFERLAHRDLHRR